MGTNGFLAACIGGRPLDRERGNPLRLIRAASFGSEIGNLVRGFKNARGPDSGTGPGVPAIRGTIRDGAGKLLILQSFRPARGERTPVRSTIIKVEGARVSSCPMGIEGVQHGQSHVGAAVLGLEDSILTLRRLFVRHHTFTQ